MSTDTNRDRKLLVVEFSGPNDAETLTKIRENYFGQELFHKGEVTVWLENGMQFFSLLMYWDGRESKGRIVRVLPENLASVIADVKNGDFSLFE